MARRVDTEGEIKDSKAKVKDSGTSPVEPLYIEVPLWKLGRIRFQCASQRASLAVLAIIMIFVAIIPLSIIEAIWGGAGTANFIETLSKALLLALGVLLGATDISRKGDS